jgi:hypothetical protein
MTARTRGRSPTRRCSCSAPAAAGKPRLARTSPPPSARSAPTARCPPRTASRPATPSPGKAQLACRGFRVEAGHAEEARRAGAYYAQLDTWYGAPEDVDLAPSSEDGYAAVMAFVAVEDWESARRAADWTLTFRYTYDVRFDSETVLGRYGFKTHGADNASPPNQHLHAFGLICLPELMRLGEPYRASALENVDCFRQFIAREDGDFGARRGMAAERYLQTDCFGHKGTLQPLSHAWSIGVLLYACEEVLN